MPHKKDSGQLIINHKRRLQKLREQQALQGLSVDPKIPLEIEDIEKQLEKLQSEVEREDYEADLQRLIERLDEDPPRYAEVQTLAERLLGTTFEELVVRVLGRGVQLSDRLGGNDLVAALNEFNERKELYKFLEELWKEVSRFHKEMDLAYSVSYACKKDIDVPLLERFLDECDEPINKLIDFAKKIKHIEKWKEKTSEGLPKGVEWAVLIKAKHKDVEDTLKLLRENPNASNLREPTKVFVNLCKAHLGYADEDLRKIVDRIYDLYKL